MHQLTVKGEHASIAISSCYSCNSQSWPMSSCNTTFGQWVTVVFTLPSVQHESSSVQEWNTDLKFQHDIYWYLLHIAYLLHCSIVLYFWYLMTIKSSRSTIGRQLMLIFQSDFQTFGVNTCMILQRLIGSFLALNIASCQPVSAAPLLRTCVH